MTIREQIKKEIDELSDDYLETLHKIIVALKAGANANSDSIGQYKENPLQNSIVFEKDIVSPINENWEVDQ
jgi:hypothetical protein